MEFRVLGSLELLRDGRSVPVTGRIAPRLLAVLILEAGHAVPLSTLIDAVWEDDPPGTARRQVQNAVSALRRTLDDVTMLESVGTGYRLNPGPATVDAKRFQDLVRRARRLRESEDPARALELLRDALDLWRGRVLAGMSGRIIESGATRLEEIRLTAIEDRVELELSLHRHPPVIGELRELLVEHPFRQRMTGQLMVALHRDGRTADAIQLYQETRTRLIEELGVDPGRALQDLHTAILRSDSDLDGPSEPPTPAVVSRQVPAQLPADTRFVGRRSQLSQLDALYRDNPDTAVLAAISGAGGTGKTALALHWSHRYRDRFPDGQLYLNLRGFDHGEAVAPREALEQFLQALGQRGSTVPTDLEAAAALYRSLSADRAILVILDNARDAEQVRRLLPGGSGSFTIVTSRNRLTGLIATHNGRAVPLDVLDRASAVELLTDIVGDRRLSDDPDAAAELAELCGRLPLALRIAAANLAEQPHLTVGGYVRQLTGPGRLELLAVDGDPDAAVATTFDLSFQRLDPPSRELFLRLGIIPGDDFPAELAAHIADLPAADVRLLLNRLETGHLIEQYQPGRYRFHDLIRLYAGRTADRMLPDQDVEAVRCGVIEWYFDNYLSLSMMEIGNIIAAFQRWGRHERAWRLVTAMTPLLAEGRGTSLVRPHAEAALRAALESGDPVACQEMYDVMASIHLLSGEAEQSLSASAKSVEVALTVGDGDLNGNLRYNHGVMLHSLGHLTAAESAMSDALRAGEDGGFLATVMAATSSLGSVYRKMGRFADCERMLVEAGRLADEHHDGKWLSLHVQFAVLRLETGRFADAWAHMDEYQARREKTGTLFFRHQALMARGDLFLAQGNPIKAVEEYTEALELAREDGSGRRESEVQLALAEALCQQGDLDAATVCAGAAATEHSDLLHRARHLLIESRIRCQAGEFAAALDGAHQALAMFAEMPSRLQQARTLSLLGDIHTGLSDSVEAQRYAAEARQLFADLGVAVRAPENPRP